MTQSVYDKSGQQVQAIDAKNKPTSYVYNARGQRVTEIDRLGFATHWAYDADGNLLSLTDAESQITSYTYNDAGQRITEQYPDHIAGAVIGDAGYGIITFTYDALGRRTVKDDQQGDTTSYNFDMSGRMLTRVYVGHPTSPLAGQTDTDTDTFTYDRNGRMLSGIKGRYNNTVTFSYDDRGQQIQETLTTHGQTYTVGYQKNELGQTTQLQYPDGSLVDRAYTPRGQLLSVDYSPAGAAASSDVADFVYDAGGRETTRNLGNGLTTSRSYFADNQIQSIATPGVETLTYTYDPNKNPTSETRSGVMAPYSWSTGPAGFDDEDRLTNWQRTNGDNQTWNLSPVHDWTSTTINGAQQTRTHGPAHEILTMAGAEVDPTPAVLQHDPKGNMTTDDRGCGMGWDFDNMLQSFAPNGVTGLKDATYGYDAIGRRVAKDVAEGSGTQTTLFVQAGQQVVCEYTPTHPTADCVRRFTYGSYVDEPLLVVGNSGNHYFSQGYRYSTMSISDSTGAAAEYFTYDLYGKVNFHDNSGVVVSSPIVPEFHTYTGRTWDSESTMYHFRNRQYSPHLGIFTTRDILMYVDGLNATAAWFVPRSVDPSGLSCCSKSQEKELSFILQSGDVSWMVDCAVKKGCLKRVNIYCDPDCPEGLNGGYNQQPWPTSEYPFGIGDDYIRICSSAIDLGGQELINTVSEELLHAITLCNEINGGWQGVQNSNIDLAALDTLLTIYPGSSQISPDEKKCGKCLGAEILAKMCAEGLGPNTGFPSLLLNADSSCQDECAGWSGGLSGVQMASSPLGALLQRWYRSRFNNGGNPCERIKDRCKNFKPGMTYN